MDILSLLESLMLLPAPSGYEKEMAYFLKDILAPYADEVHIDRIGNVIGKIGGVDKTAPSVMVFAHMDQLGFITRKIEPDGYLQVDRLGGIPEKVLPGLRLVVRSGDGHFHPAVIGIKSHHATQPEEKYKVDPVTSLFIDLGAKSDRQVREMGIDIGCPAIYRPSFEKLQGSRICGTAVDNRGGCASLVRTASLLHQNRPKSDVYFVGTVWEEFNLRGAAVAARSIRPDIALCLDVVLSGDTPDLRNRFEAKLGEGPAINLYTFHGRGTLNGTLPHEGLVKLALKSAVDAGLPVQRCATLGVITDSAYVQLEGAGIAVLDLGFAARYTHSPVEVCDVPDLENLSKLVSTMILQMDSGFNLNRY